MKFPFFPLLIIATITYCQPAPTKNVTRTTDLIIYPAKLNERCKRRIAGLGRIGGVVIRNLRGVGPAIGRAIRIGAARITTSFRAIYARVFNRVAISNRAVTSLAPWSTGPITIGIASSQLAWAMSLSNALSFAAKGKTIHNQFLLIFLILR